jgi:hypothetical protein
VAAIPVVEVPVAINPHPDYARRPGSGQNGGASPAAPATAPVAAAPTPSVPTPPASHPGGNQPVHERLPEPAPAPGNPVNHGPSGPPVHENPVPVPVAPSAPSTPPAAPPRIEPPRIESPKIDPSKTTDKDKKAAVLAPGEVDIYRQVLQDVDPAAPNYAKALADLNTWARQFPNSAFANDRLYYYIHTYNGTGRADKVLDTAAPLVTAGVGNSFRDQQQVLQILVAASASVQKLPKPTALEVATGQRAAQELLTFLPDYFSPRRKPADVSDAAWSFARTQLETVAKQALAKRPAALAANK